MVTARVSHIASMQGAQEGFKTVSVSGTALQPFRIAPVVSTTVAFSFV
jgi:hypothetical protein